MMQLPLPTTSSLDVPNEKLKDVERRRGMPAPNIGGAVRDAVVVTNAVTEMSDTERKRKEADWFQKEYVDKGWEGYEKLWSESGAPPEAAPQIVRTSIGDNPVAAFKYLGELGEKAKTKKGTEAYATSIEPKDPEAAAAIRSGVIPPATVYTNRQKDERDEKAGALRKEISDAKIDLQRTQKILDRAVAWARVNKPVAGFSVASLKKNQDDLDAANKEVADLEAGDAALLDPGKLTDARTRRRALIDLVRRMESKIPAGEPEAAPPAEETGTGGAPKAYPNAKQGKDGGWYIPDPKRSGKYLKVG